ncbi:MAG: OmpH family outer membrane protein [Candidatus Gastranaerophilales bacterium]|nr:OmpH family outer membrane protein [Candidatus Gastranaerophilales bacterium]
MFNSKFTGYSLIAMSAFAIGFWLNSQAFSNALSAGGVNIAVVDVNKVVSDSSQVKALKKQQEAKHAELAKWLEIVKADINKQSTEEGKKKLAKKYDDALAKKEETIRKEYEKSLIEIDKNITQTIANAAKNDGYTLVLSKGIVLFGGDDITKEISKLVK